MQTGAEKEREGGEKRGRRERGREREKEGGGGGGVTSLHNSSVVSKTGRFLDRIQMNAPEQGRGGGG